MMQAIIIDGDGVVINRDKRFSDRLQADYGITTETTAPFFGGVFQKCVVGKADLKEELAHCYKNWGWKGTLKELLHYWFSKEGLHNEKMLQIIAKLRAHGISVFLLRIFYARHKFFSEYFSSIRAINYLHLRILFHFFDEILMAFKLYNAPQSTCSQRVRFVLNAGVRFSEASKLTPEQLSEIFRKVAKAMCEKKPE